MEIKVEHNPSKEQLEKLGVYGWGTWSKKVSEFEWFYDDQETCYFLQGEVIVTPKDGQPVTLKAGDLVVFPQGMACTWKVLKDVKKHYLFE